MIRKLSAFTIATALVMASTSTMMMMMMMTTTTAHAASQATATSVSLSTGDDCGRADLDLGIVAGAIDREYGLATNALGATLAEFEHESTNLDDLNGVYEGYGIVWAPDEPSGTIIGSYAYLGTTPPQAATAAEWFVLYRCDTGGDNQVMYTCFGDYGTCPRTATQGLGALLGVTVSTTTPAPGQTVVVTAAGCTSDLGSLAGVSLLRDSTFLTGVFPIIPNPDGSFQVPVTVPDDVAPDTALVLRTVCGHDDVVVASADVSLTVTLAEPAPEPTEPPILATREGSTSPRFTG